MILIKPEDQLCQRRKHEPRFAVPPCIAEMYGKRQRNGSWGVCDATKQPAQEALDARPPGLDVLSLNQLFLSFHEFGFVVHRSVSHTPFYPSCGTIGVDDCGIRRKLQKQRINVRFRGRFSAGKQINLRFRTEIDTNMIRRPK